MLTKIEVEKTYWVGMTADQKESLKGALLHITERVMGNNYPDFSVNEKEAIDDLRQALLNA